MRPLYPPSTLFPYTTLFRSRLLVARPALDDRELARVVERDVDCAVAALRQPADRASAGGRDRAVMRVDVRSEEHTSEVQSLRHLVCRLLLEKKYKKDNHKSA